MALSIGSATYGRDTQGKKTLLKDLSNDLEAVRKELSGSEYKALTDTIDKYWVGKDATEFKNKIKTTINSIDAEIKKMKSTLENDFDTDTKGFAKLQSTNANTISQLK